VVQLNQSAGIEEVAGQRSTFPSIGDDFGGHGSGNLGKTPANIVKARSRLGFLESFFNALDVLDGQIGPALNRGFDDAYQYALVLSQIQRLKGPQNAVLVHGVNLVRHVTIVSRNPLGSRWLLALPIPFWRREWDSNPR
jgi:hypothetical protein